MKIWKGYSSEHSMNLVMIGRFKEVGEAVAAKLAIDQFVQFVSNEQVAGRLRSGEPERRYSKETLDFLKEQNVFTIGTTELEQFAYEALVVQKENTIEVTTDECDVSAFLKLLLHHEAKIEVFSAHHHEKDEPKEA